MSHSRRIEAELDARLATNGASVGDIAVGTISSHGHRALSSVVGTVQVGAAASDSGNCGGDGWFAVHRRR